MAHARCPTAPFPVLLSLGTAINYYHRHVGDYIRDTAHLSLLEHGVYGRVLDIYYLNEGPVADETIARLVGARTEDERKALESVLNDFFDLSGGLWTQTRCEREIAGYRAMGEGGRRGAKKRWDKPLDGHPIATPSKPLCQPVTSNQEPITKKETSAAVLRIAPPDAFDGTNAEALNGKAVVMLSPGWELPAEWGEAAMALGFKAAEALHEGEKYRQYWTAGKGSGKRRTVKGWRQSWSNWLSTAAERRR